MALSESVPAPVLEALSYCRWLGAEIERHQLEVNRLSRERAEVIAALIDRGTQPVEVARQLNLSRPRVSQLVSKLASNVAGLTCERLVTERDGDGT
jgi:hypothetical protein